MRHSPVTSSSFNGGGAAATASEEPTSVENAELWTGRTGCGKTKKLMDLCKRHCVRGGKALYLVPGNAPLWELFIRLVEPASLDGSDIEEAAKEAEIGIHTGRWSINPTAKFLFSTYGTCFEIEELWNKRVGRNTVVVFDEIGV